MIYNKEPIQVLWNMFKDLESDNLKIFKEAMTKDKNSVPKSYIILRTEIGDNPDKYGDGNCLTRSSDCDIILISDGSDTNSKSLHNINKKKIKERLKENLISYHGTNLGYNIESKNTQYTFSFNLNYIS